MNLSIDVHLLYEMTEPTDLLVQIEVADLADQRVLSTTLDMSHPALDAPVAAEAGMGRRLWVQGTNRFRCDYSTVVAVERPALDLATLDAHAPRALPGDVVRYLMPSRFCPSDKLQTFAETKFGALEGGAKVAAMRDWIEASFAYVPGSSDGGTTALDTFVQREGVCRDFAHVLITLARGASIPARFASVYAPGVTPGDFHAVAEVFLGGSWHLVDATGMAPADTIARIGVGMDAAETAFLTAFGVITLVAQSVTVSAVGG